MPWVLLVGGLLVLGWAAARLLPYVLLGATLAAVAVGAWLFWQPTAAWRTLGPVVRPAAARVARQASTDAALYAQWALRQMASTRHPTP